MTTETKRTLKLLAVLAFLTFVYVPSLGTLVW